MTEQRSNAPVIPKSSVLEALKGTISDPVKTTSAKPATKDQLVSVRLVAEGAGMVGLTDREDNKEWAGIFNHILTTARVATFLAQQLQEKGEEVDPSVILNTVLVSHAGRRQWDESNWYPDAVPNADVKSKMGDQALTTEILTHEGLPDEILAVVDAHGVGIRYPVEQMDTWEKKVSMYADFRVSQSTNSLDERFTDLQKRAIDDPIAQGRQPRLSQEALDAIKRFAYTAEEEIFSKLAIHTEDITDTNPPMPRWEQYIRRLYVQDAELGIFTRLHELEQQLARGEITEARINEEFPESTWWGQYARELYSEQHGKPHYSRPGLRNGIDRAISFYKWIETRDKDQPPQTKENEHLD